MAWWFTTHFWCWEWSHGQVGVRLSAFADPRGGRSRDAHAGHRIGGSGPQQFPQGVGCTVHGRLSDQRTPHWTFLERGLSARRNQGFTIQRQEWLEEALQPWLHCEEISSEIDNMQKRSKKKSSSISLACWKFWVLLCSLCFAYNKMI